MMRLLLIGRVASGLYGQAPAEQLVTEFMGHKVILVVPKRNADGYAGEPYHVCFDATTPTRQCYTPEDRFYGAWGPDPELVPTDLGRGLSALLFSVWATSGGSGANIHLALLRPSVREGVENLLPGDVELTEISGHAFSAEPSVSDAPIFVTADFVWGPLETHPENHRYIISVYLIDRSTDRYYLEDRYMTARKYEGDLGFEKKEVLDGEKPEILARLKRVKAERERAEAERQAQPPR
jgi:hypothetical protein